MELGYKDDCESWIYMVVDMCNRKGLPWKMEKDKDNVGVLKEKILNSSDEMKRLFFGVCSLKFLYYIK